MRLHIMGAGVIVAVAMITLGVQRFTSDVFAPASLPEEDATLVVIAGWSMLLGTLTTRRQAGIAAILELLAGGLTVLAAGPGHVYLFGYGGAAMLVAVLTMIAALPSRALAPRSVVPSPGTDAADPRPVRVRDRVRAVRERKTTRAAGRSQDLRRNRARIHRAVYERADDAEARIREPGNGLGDVSGFTSAASE